MADNVDRVNLYIPQSQNVKSKRIKKIKNKNEGFEEDMLASGSGHL